VHVWLTPYPALTAHTRTEDCAPIGWSQPFSPISTGRLDGADGFALPHPNNLRWTDLISKQFIVVYSISYTQTPRHLILARPWSIVSKQTIHESWLYNIVYLSYSFPSQSSFVPMPMPSVWPWWWCFPRSSDDGSRPILWSR